MSKSILHGTAVAFGGAAVLLRGASGAGKSDVALRLIGLGAVLVADDQVEVDLRSGRPYVRGIDPVKGLLEIRGVGIVKCAVAEAAVLKLVIDLVAREAVPRIPDWDKVDMQGIMLPRLAFHAFDASTPLKIRQSMALVEKPELLVN